MIKPIITCCPGTLAKDHTTYSRTALNRVFKKKSVSHILPYTSPTAAEEMDELYTNNRIRMSISGVQQKFSVRLEKNKIRLINDGEQGEYILKPAPIKGKHPDQMPANEHLTMQIARQVYGIETAENALIFFSDGSPAYITKRFDFQSDGSKWAQEDFASLAGRTPATHGADYKYLGNYFELFELMKKLVPAYPVESVKLYRRIIYNYLFSNGDAHFKNFSLIETSLGDFRLSPAYDLLNSSLHVDDTAFALKGGLLPPQYAQGKIQDQFLRLGELAGIPESQIQKTIALFSSYKDEVLALVARSFLSQKKKRQYEQTFLARLKRFNKS